MRHSPQLRHSWKPLAIWALVGGLAVTAAGQSEPTRDVRKVLIEADSPAHAELTGRLLARYERFDLLEVEAAQLDRLSPRLADGIVVRDQPDELRMAVGPIDTSPDAAPPSIPVRFTEPPSTTGARLFLIQFVGPVRDEWLEEVRAAGATPIHAFPVNGYTVWAPEESIQLLTSMAAERTILQFAGPYHPYYKLTPELSARLLSGDPREVEEVITVTVQRYAGALDTETRQLVLGLAQEVVAGWWPILDYENARIRVPASVVEEIARQRDVVWVGEWHERELFDEVQDQIVRGYLDAGNTGPIGPGYLGWLQSLGFSTDPADYPVVDVTDDGIGGGSAPTQPVNTPTEDPTLDPRVVYRNSCNSSYPDDGRSPDGHGHINASIVGGLDNRAGSPFQDGDGFQRGLGVNPHGRLGGTRIFGGSYNVALCGGTDAGVIDSSYSAGGRISSNSWGCSGCAGSYDDSSQAYDLGTRDAVPGTPGNQEMLFVFSAGNSGPGSGTIGSPGNGKNMLTVGASENDRPTWTDGCGIGPSGADNAMDVIGFSSRGPAPGGRTKPETIAPGTHIQGTASTHPQYNGSGVCDTFQPAGQTVFAASSGTSHSAPAVSGAASLVHWWLRSVHGVAAPSPALLKAYVLAHVIYLTGVSGNGDLPTNAQGYGMPDLQVAFDDTPRYLVNQEILFDASGQLFSVDGAIPDSSRPVRVVMTFTDAPGALGTSPQVNDLDLQVIVNGTTYRGNVFSGQFSQAGGSADSANNYEAVFLPAGTMGAVQIRVLASAVNGDGVPGNGDPTDQDFALVAYNVSQIPNFTLSVTPETQEVCAPADASYSIELGSILGFDEPVTLSASGNPAGTTVAFVPNPVGSLPGSSTLTIGNTGGAAPGDSDILVTGVSSPSGLNRSVTVGLGIDAGLPSAVSLLTPADGATGVDTAATFTWEAATGASSYDIEIATDSGFLNVVEGATGLTDTSYTSGNLSPNTLHFWRVRAQNGCGVGSWSASFSFTTQNVVCRNPNVAIPDGDPDGVTDTLVLSSGEEITDLDVSLVTAHTWVGDLEYTLRHVDTGTAVTIFDRPGVPASTFGCSGDDIDAVLDDEAATPVEDECSTAIPTIDGTFQPNQLLSAFDGESLDGTWELTVVDHVPADPGTLNEWCLLPSTITIPSTVHVGDLDGSTANQGPTWTATVTVAVHDADHGAVSGAEVTGTWSGGFSGAGTCMTNGSGQCTVTSGGIRKREKTATFTVDGVSAAGATYMPAENHDPDGDSDGTTITVSRLPQG